MTRSASCIAFGASLLALFWLASPAAAQVTFGGECDDGIDNDDDGLTDFPDDPGCRNRMSHAYELTECSDGLNNDGDEWGMVDCDDPQCLYQGECLEWWDDESRKRPKPMNPWGDGTGCGEAFPGELALLLPFLWSWRRGRRSRKA